MPSVAAVAVAAVALAGMVTAATLSADRAQAAAPGRSSSPVHAAAPFPSGPAAQLPRRSPNSRTQAQLAAGKGWVTGWCRSIAVTC